MKIRVTDVAAETDSLDRRRRAVDNARAIVGFSGGSVSAEMEQLNERFVSGDLSADEVVAERLSLR